jgi:DegV family protein with EDD domain
MSIRIVTDSAADLPPEVVEALDITVVPLCVLFGEEVFRDRVDLTTDQFFEKLVTSPVHPSTSQPSVGAFQETYLALRDHADAIVSIHISGKLSGTVAAAEMARECAGEACPIEIVDSEGASLGLGFAVTAAARAAKAGASVEGVIAAAKSVATRQHTLAMLDTLEYARRGGRLSRAEALLGNLLHVKAVISVKGDVRAVGRARTRPAAIKRMFDLAMAHPAIEQVGIMHAISPEDAEMLAGWTRELLPKVPIHVTRIGPALGAHGGPGIVAMTVVEGENAKD